MGKSSIRTIVAFMSAILWVAVTDARAQSRADVTMVIDYSASMWGQIDGKNKVVIVHDGLQTLLAPRIGKMDFAAVGFGPSEKKSCRDTPVLAEAGPLTQDQLDFVKARRPKGAAAIAASLRAGAAVGRGKKRAMILIADGPDSCRQDPCAVAAQLNSEFPGLTIHGIALNKTLSGKLQSLKCIVEPSGGQFQTASNEVEFVAALSLIMKSIDDASAPKNIARKPEKLPVMPGASFAGDIASQQGGLPNALPGQRGWIPPTNGSPAASPNIPQVTAPGQPPETQQGNGFDTRTTLAVRVPNTASTTRSLIRTLPFVAEGGAELKSPVTWRVYRQDKGASQPTLVATKRSTRADFILEPGVYYVNGAFGQAQETKKVTLTAGETRDVPIILNVGGVQVVAILPTGMEVPTSQVRYTIKTDERDQFGRRSTVLANARVGQIVRLNAGLYHLESRFGDANAVVESDFVVEPGRLTKVTVQHASTRTTLKLVLKEGGEALAGTEWLIQTSGGETVKSVVGALPTLILALGDYKVTAKRAGLVFRQDFSLPEAGQAVIEVVANSQKFIAPRPTLAIPGITIDALPETR